MADMHPTAGSEHQEVQRLLPWRATDRLDAPERARVDAHLAVCAECRADYAEELRLAAAVVAEVPDATPSIDRGWEALATRLALPEPAIEVPPLPVAVPRRDRPGRWRAASRAVMRPDRLRWMVAAQFTGLLVLGTLAWPASPRHDEYRALGDASATRHGNVLAMFRPGMREEDLRHLLNASGARLVDGPTAANAYVLDVPGGNDGASLKALRNSPDVTMAEPIAEAPAE